jgi:predicted phage terminase large subunit-like protein
MLDSLDRLDRLERRMARYLPEPEREERPAATDEPAKEPDRRSIDQSVYDTIARLSPQLRAPRHLDALVQEFDAAIAPHTGQRFFWFSVPPRHWKTFTIRHAFARHLDAWPAEEVAYVSHTQAFANKQSRAVKKLLLRGGIEPSRDTNRQDEWELDTGGGFVARGLGGELTGRGFRLIVIDDPIKRASEAESFAQREEVFRSIDEDVITRLSPDGCVFLVHTRWHPDDPIGRFREVEGWRGTNIKALSGPAEDQPLLPDVWGFEHLSRIRRTNVYKFAAQYQGEPRPRGGSLFGDVHRYATSELPTVGYRVAYGIDLAVTAKASADFSVCVKLITDGERYFVTDVIRAQVEAPAFMKQLAAATKETATIRWYVSGTERGAGQFIRSHLPDLDMRTASADKYTRAQPVAEAWNDGRILVPGGENAPAWVDDFTRELGHFTGKSDPHDDQVDALAAAFDALQEDDFTAALANVDPIQLRALGASLRH